MIETLRAFVAVNVDVASSRRVAALQRSLRSSPAAVAGRVAWVSPAAMHLTVRFLGEIDAAVVPAIADSLRGLVEALPAVRLALGPLSAFPGADRARVLVVDARDPDGTLPAFASRVEAMVRSLGFRAEERDFRPHLTLARLRAPTPVQAWLAALEPVSLGEARVTECVLYRSELKRTGAEYTAIVRHALPAPATSRSQRPSRGPRQASQRPARPRSKAPQEDAARPQLPPSIPKPPRLPSIPAPGPTGGAGAPAPVDAPEKPQAPAISAGPANGERAGSSILPPAVEAGLPPDEDWGD